MKPSVLIFAFLLGMVVVASCLKTGWPSKENRKQLAGPPTEFAFMNTPTPESTAIRADSTITAFKLAAASDGTFSWTASYPIDAHDRWTLSIASPYFDQFNIWIQPPGAAQPTRLEDNLFNHADSIAQKSSGPFGIDGNSVPTTSYSIFDPQLGVWTITINSTAFLPTSVAHGYAILDNQSRLKLVSHLNSFYLAENQQLGLVVRLAEETPTATVGLDGSSTVEMQEVALTSGIQNAEMQVTFPDGSKVLVGMTDDGKSIDLVAGDGTYGAAIDATVAGQYIFQAVINGVDANGLAFTRTSQHLVAVSRRDVALTGTASAVVANDITTFQLSVTLPAELKASTEDSLTVRAYAEVWGTPVNAPDAAKIGVAWVSAMVDPTILTNGQDVLELDMNNSWLGMVSAVAPFELRNVILQDINSNSIINQISSIDVTIESADAILLMSQRSAPVTEVTEAMLFGPRPAHLQMGSKRAAGKLMLVHGYCSSDVWPSNQFTDTVKFEDYTQSRSQDQFAKQILAFGESLGLPSYGIVGHSQGGLASLHLKTYYWSGLDTATGGRKIQSVGSPYAGCSLAGSLADLGSVFGVGCASNFDLSIEGATLWLAKVPTSTRSEVYYYTTQYSDDWWISSACVTGGSLVMYEPNDGTCEKKFGQLPGANNMGHTMGQCHTSGMKYPAQTQDAARNAEINRLAAR